MRAALALARPGARSGRAAGASPCSATCWNSAPRRRALHRGLAEADRWTTRSILSFAAGPLMRHLWQALPSERRGGYAEDASALEAQVLAAVRAGDVVMVKGSLGSRMGPLVKALERHLCASRRARNDVRCKAERMLYWLIEFSDKLSVLNVFRYITFRTGGAMITGAAVRLPVRPGDHRPAAGAAGQGPADPRRRPAIASRQEDRHADHGRADDPVRRGGRRPLLWANLTNPYVWIVLGVTLGFGAIGFYDDYLKVTQADRIPASPAGRGCSHRSRRSRSSPASRIVAARPAAVRDLADVSLLQGPA